MEPQDMVLYVSRHILCPGPSRAVRYSQVQSVRPPLMRSGKILSSSGRVKARSKDEQEDLSKEYGSVGRPRQSHAASLICIYAFPV